MNNTNYALNICLEQKQTIIPTNSNKQYPCFICDNQSEKYIRAWVGDIIPGLNYNRLQEISRLEEMFKKAGLKLIIDNQEYGIISMSACKDHLPKLGELEGIIEFGMITPPLLQGIIYDSLTKTSPAQHVLQPAP